MPTSVPRGAPFLLLPPLLMLSAVLAVPVDRAAPPQEDSQAVLQMEQRKQQQRRHREHPKVNVPGSQAQLKEVWEELDGLDPNRFNPKTFFILHDINSDGVLDEQELEALFTKELEKVYDPKNEEDDMREMEEERLRMREHVMKNVDTNQDRLVTLEEFLASTQRKEFGDTGEGWKTVEMSPAYTEEELKRFEEELAAREAELNARAQRLSQETEALGRSQDRLEAQKRELQQAVLQMEQNRGYPVPQMCFCWSTILCSQPLGPGSASLSRSLPPLSGINYRS